MRSIRVRSLILETASRENGEFEITGIAWTGDGAISKVEVSWDGGNEWHDAEVANSSSRFDVQRWKFLWKPNESGEFRIISRASDDAGRSQPESDLWNRGGYGNNGPHGIEISI